MRTLPFTCLKRSVAGDSRRGTVTPVCICACTDLCFHLHARAQPRIVEHLKGERNYHVFYMVCKAESSGKFEDNQACVMRFKKFEDYPICYKQGITKQVGLPSAQLI